VGLRSEVGHRTGAGSSKETAANRAEAQGGAGNTKKNPGPEKETTDTISAASADDGRQREKFLPGSSKVTCANG